MIGAAEIADFVNELLGGTEYTEHDMYNWISRRRLPGGKFGTRVCSSRKAIRRRLAAAAGLSAP